MREYVESGRLAFEEWSHLALGLRFRAAAMGVPFLPSLTMLGSSLMDVGGSKTIECPYTGETLHAVPALFPDVALLHVHRADRFGNCQIDGYPHMDADIARAADHRARDRRGDRAGRGDPPASRSHGDPGLRRRRARPRAVRLLSARVLRPLRRRARALHRVRRRRSSARRRAGVTDYLERYVYAPRASDDYLALFGERAPPTPRARPGADDVTVTPSRVSAHGQRAARGDGRARAHDDTPCSPASARR